MIFVIRNNTPGNVDSADSPTSPNTEGNNNISEYLVSGTWYSNQQRVDTLMLNDDGSYSSSYWLAAGNYQVDGDKIILTDIYGTSKSLSIIDNNEDLVLYFDNAHLSHYYYMSKRTDANNIATDSDDKVYISNNNETPPLVDTEDYFDDMQVMYKAAVSQILTTGGWVDVRGETTLTFTDEEYTAVYTSTILAGETEQKTTGYNILEVTALDNEYKVKWESVESDGRKSIINDIILTSKDNDYTLYSFSFPFAKTYIKSEKIYFTQPEASGTRIDVGSGATSAIELSREDNPDSSNHEKEVFAEIDRLLVGVWSGTYDDILSDDTVYYRYMFSNSGDYTYTVGDYVERGSYNAAHIAGNFYHTTLSLKDNSNNERMVNINVSGGAILYMTVEGGGEPRYKKE